MPATPPLPSREGRLRTPREPRTPAAPGRPWLPVSSRAAAPRPPPPPRTLTFVLCQLCRPPQGSAPRTRRAVRAFARGLRTRTPRAGPGPVLASPPARDPQAKVSGSGRAHAAQAKSRRGRGSRAEPGRAAAGGVGLRLQGERRPGPESAAPPPRPPPPPRRAPGGSASRTRQLSLQPHSQRGAWRPSCLSLPAHPSRSSLHQQQGNTASLRLRIWSRLNILFIFSD